MVLGFLYGLGNVDVEIVVTIECKYELVTLYELSEVNELNDDEYLKLDACCDRAVNPNVVTDSPGKDCKCTDVSIFEEFEADDVDNICGNGEQPLLKSIRKTLTQLERKTRQLIVHSLEEDLVII